MLLLILAAMVVLFLYKESAKAKVVYHDPATRVSVRGQSLRCPHCTGAEFYRREVLTGISIKKILKWQLPLQSSTNYACVRCGHVAQFLAPQEVVHTVIVEADFSR